MLITADINDVDEDIAQDAAEVYVCAVCILTTAAW